MVGGPGDATVADMALYALGDLEPKIHPEAFVHPDAVLIGDVRIDARASVWPGAVLRGDEGHVEIGPRTSVQDGTVIHTTPFQPTTVGADCVIGHLVHLEGCVIEHHSLIGSSSVVLHRSHVGPWALVGAGAVVPNGVEVPEGALALGIPAKVRPGAADRELIEHSVASYLARVDRYSTDLRRLG